MTPQASRIFCALARGDSITRIADSCGLSYARAWSRLKRAVGELERNNLRQATQFVPAVVFTIRPPTSSRGPIGAGLGEFGAEDARVVEKPRAASCLTEVGIIRLIYKPGDGIEDQRTGSIENRLVDRCRAASHRSRRRS